ncbi:MAG: LPS export ABC transporter permease LptG [Candidatus Eisenbacteria sp.]|nr:LPS export ABC transporter permease LptG [Candidatus Eisenbacteria bacterium]
MLRIIDRYLLRGFLLYLLLGLIAFIGIYVIVNLFEKIDTFVDNKASLHAILFYYIYAIPVIAVQVLPVAMLLGAILSLGQLRKFNEITAMQASGISPLRITSPLLVCALVITAAAYVLSEKVMPAAYDRQTEIMEVKIKKCRPAAARGRSGIYYMGRCGRVYVAQAFSPQPPVLTDLSVQHFRSEASRQQLWRRVDARNARWEAGTWCMKDGFVRIFSGDEEVAAAFRTYCDSRYDEQPDEFAHLKNDPLYMSRQQLKDYIQRIRESGARVQEYLVNYHLKAAFPLANFIMVLLGACLSLRIVRGTLALGFGISMSLGFTYYGFIRAGQALGCTGTVPPFLAAWLGNLIFLVVGVFLFWKMNR